MHHSAVYRRIFGYVSLLTIAVIAVPRPSSADVMDVIPILGLHGTTDPFSYTTSEGTFTTGPITMTLNPDFDNEIVRDFTTGTMQERTWMLISFNDGRGNTFVGNMVFIDTAPLITQEGQTVTGDIDFSEMVSPFFGPSMTMLIAESEDKPKPRHTCTDLTCTWSWGVATGLLPSDVFSGQLSVPLTGSWTAKVQSPVQVVVPEPPPLLSLATTFVVLGIIIWVRKRIA